MNGTNGRKMGFVAPASAPDLSGTLVPQQTPQELMLAQQEHMLAMLEMKLKAAEEQAKAQMAFIEKLTNSEALVEMVNHLGTVPGSKCNVNVEFIETTKE